MSSIQLSSKVLTNVQKHGFRRAISFEQRLILISQKNVWVMSGDQKLSQLNLVRSTSKGLVNLYFATLVLWGRIPYTILVFTDRIAVYRGRVMLFKFQLKQPLHRYINFYYDTNNQHFVILGSTLSDDFTLMIVVNLFQRQMLQLTVDYRGIFSGTGRLFPQLPIGYLYIDQIAFLENKRMLLYNKNQQEVYICDLKRLFEIYSKRKEEYDDGVFVYDQMQNTLPIQAIIGYYSRIKADRILALNDKVILVQESDPITHKVWKEIYELHMDLTLHYLTSRE